MIREGLSEEMTLEGREPLWSLGSLFAENPTGASKGGAEAYGEEVEMSSRRGWLSGRSSHLGEVLFLAQD